MSYESALDFFFSFIIIDVLPCLCCAIDLISLRYDQRSKLEMNINYMKLLLIKPGRQKKKNNINEPVEKKNRTPIQETCTDPHRFHSQMIEFHVANRDAGVH